MLARDLSSGNRLIVFADGKLAAVFIDVDDIARRRTPFQFFSDSKRFVLAVAGCRMLHADHGILERGISLGITVPWASAIHTV